MRTLRKVAFKLKPFHKKLEILHTFLPLVIENLIQVRVDQKLATMQRLGLNQLIESDNENKHLKSYLV